MADLSLVNICALVKTSPERRDEYDVLEIAPRRRETVYVTGRGSVYEMDEEERRRRRKSRVSR